MASQAGRIRRLILATRRSLEPAPFPPRRDLDVAWARSDDGGNRAVFHDLFWPRTERIACLVASIDGGESGHLEAHAFKALMRAALRSYPADTALALSEQAFRATSAARIEAAAATLCTETGGLTLGGLGRGRALPLAPDAGPGDGHPSAALACGAFCWLSVGDVAAPVPAGNGADAAADLVRAALAGTHGAAAAALGLRGLRAPSGRTFVLTNDAAQISPLLLEAEQYVRTAGAPAAALAGFDVALDEVLTNIVLYAYGDGNNHEIVVDVRLDGRVLRVEIRDDGRPFDPTAAAEPDLEADLVDRPIGGLGLHLVRAVFDSVGYRRDRGWNVLSLTKDVTAASRERPATAGEGTGGPNA